MTNALTLLPYLGPLALALVALLARLEPGTEPRRVLAASRMASLTALGLSVGSAAAVILYGSLQSPLIGNEWLAFGVRLDALSTVMFLLVAFVGVVVVEYSRNYLAGDAGHGRFLGGLCLTLAFVQVMVLSATIAQLVLAWIATSLAFHRLLLFYSERPTAVRVARYKSGVTRLGDLCLVAAWALLVTGFGTGEIAAIAELAAVTEVGPAIAGATVCLILAAALKSAQFPFHGWLPHVVETPTPVSALLHAGIINAGGFLIVRFADVMTLVTPSLWLLALIGALTAVFGSLVMLTQATVKVQLAYSTVAQMGFMLLQCGLGAFSMAVLHIVAHSLYKAHAFLSSGSALEMARGTQHVSSRPARPARLGLGLAAGVAALAAMLTLLGVSPTAEPGTAALAAIFALGAMLLVGRGVDAERPLYVVPRLALAAAAATGAYVGLKAGAEALLAGSLPVAGASGTGALIAAALAVAVFAALVVGQLLYPAGPRSARGRAIYVHLRNGLYADILLQRLTRGRIRTSILDN